jgi:hypothetical protein
MARGQASAYHCDMAHLTPLERAFALARTGDYAGVSEIRNQLQAEGYETRQLEGPALLKQLRALCDAARHVSPA